MFTNLFDQYIITQANPVQAVCACVKTHYLLLIALILELASVLKIHIVTLEESQIWLFKI